MPLRETRPSTLWGSSVSPSQVMGAGRGGTWGHLPLALAGVQDELLVAPGADSQLMLRGVEDVQEQVALPGTVWKTKES